MAGLQPSLSDPEFENWVKAGLSLQYTKDGIENFVDTVIDNLHKVILNSLPFGVTCTNCATYNIIKCARNNNFCKFAGRACLVHDPNNANKYYRPCPSNVCNKIRDEIIAKHRYGKPTWQNTDARQWCTNRWKIAVCYMSIGYSQQTSAWETDLPGLISCVINNTYFQIYVADNLSVDNNIFRQTRTSRNSILHNPRQRLTDVELRAHIATFTSVLSDTKSLSTDTNGITALTNLQQLKNNTISITTQHTGQILAEALNAIKEAGQEEIDNLKAEKETIIALINERIKAIEKKGRETLTHISESKTGTLTAIDKKSRETVTHISESKTGTLTAIDKKSRETLTHISESKTGTLTAIDKKSRETLTHISESKTGTLTAIDKKSRETLTHISESKTGTLTAIDKKSRETLTHISESKTGTLTAIDNKSRETLTHISESKTGTLTAIDKKSRESLTHISESKTGTLTAIDKKYDQFTGDITKISEHSLKRIAEEEIHSVDAVKKTKYECSGQLQRKTGEHIQTLTEKTNESVALIAKKTNKTLEDITSLRNEDTDRKQYEAVKELQQELVTLYQKESRFLTTTIYPLIQHRNRNIEDLYVPPYMRTVDKETLKPDEQVHSIEDIFRDNSKNIYVVGDAGTGKSSLCKKIVYDWCKCKSENETSFTGSSDDTSNSLNSDETSSSGSENEPSDALSTDKKYMQDFSFVFYISLRDCNTDLKIIDMIKHQLLEEICGCDYKTLISLLRKEKYLIVLDGLDEWTPKVIQSTTYSRYSRVMIPDRKGVRTCTILTTTRPWKLEAVCLESSQIDRRIQLFGIGEDSHEAFIRHMAKQMNPEIDIDYFLYSFLEEVENKNLNEFLSIPVILKQLVCIWNQSNELRETKTSVYSQMLNLILEIAHSRLQDNANYKVIKSTETSMNVKLPKCFAEDKQCIEFVSLLCPLSKLAFETLLSDTPESSLVFETSTTEIHGLTQEQVNLCLDIGILSQTKYLTKQNYLEEHTKISFLHKTYQEFLAALWLSLETNDENKQTNIQKFKNKCSTITSMLELSEFLIFVSGMNSKASCELSEHTREITTRSDIIRKYRQSIEISDKSEVRRVQKLTISCIKEGWECSHSDCHLYLEDIVDSRQFGSNEDKDVIDRLIEINKSNIKSLLVIDVSLQSHDNSLLEVCGLEKLSLKWVRDRNILQCLISQSNNTISALVLDCSVFNNVGILHNTPCLTRLGLYSIYLSHRDKLDVMSYLSQTHRMKEIKLFWVNCKDCGRDDCSPVLDLSQHDQLECLSLKNINVDIDTVVNVTNMVKCELSYITPVNVTKSIHNAPKLTDLYLGSWQPEEAAAMLECISHQKYIERLRIHEIDFGSSELVLSSDYRNLKYVRLFIVTMTKRSFRGVIDRILACNQAVLVDVHNLYIKPVEGIEDIVDNMRHSSRCQVMKDHGHKEGEIGWFKLKTIPSQQK